MIKAGGILGIIAGVFGFIAAIITTFFGGLASGFEKAVGGTEDAGFQIIGLGVGGVIFALIVLIYGILVLASKKKLTYGIALLAASIAGCIFGGTLVAFAMILSIIGGILVIAGSRKLAAAETTGDLESTQPSQGGLKKTTKLLIPTLIVVVLSIIFSIKMVTGKTQKTEKMLLEVENLASAEITPVDPHGVLAEMFAFGSKYTDLQRENAIKALKGKIVAWQLPVYEIKKEGDFYRVQTQQSTSAVGAIVVIKPRNNEEVNFLGTIKTNDTISFKGKVDGVGLGRYIIIKPAILYKPVAAEKADSEETAEKLQNKAVAYLNEGRYSEGIQLLYKVIALEPKNALAYCNLGGALYSIGDTQKAIQYLTKGIEIDPKLDLCYYNRAFCYDRLGTNESEKVEDLKRAARLNRKEAQDILRRNGIDW